MTIQNVITYLDDWAPPGVAWERDNPGLQVGDVRSEVKKILLCLDVTEQTVQEARKKNCNVILSHHPLIFHSLKKINTTTDPVSRIISALLKNDITLLSYHTNLDFTKDGVSFALAECLRLTDIRFLKHADSNQSKLVVFVPESHSAAVASAVFAAGGGIIGNYSNCSFSLEGTGTFLGSEKTNPTVGQKETFESVAERRLEILCDNWKLEAVKRALLNAHPYEEPACDIYPLKNTNVNYGAGALGFLPEALSEEVFGQYVTEKLGLNGLRFVAGKGGPIRSVAVCGGAGSDLLNTAVLAGADAFVTADVSYHTFREAAGNIFLADAGHYETEIVILEKIKERLQGFLRKDYPVAEVILSEFRDNPVTFVK